MEDDELKALRTRRMAELQEQYGVTQGGKNERNANQEQEQKAKEEEMRNYILSQVLTQEARARLSTLAAAKPEKSKMVEDMLINMARTGQIQGKLVENEFKNLLEKVSEHTTKKTTVKKKKQCLKDFPFSFHM
ncbi:programmed cell death 5 isoform X2 [Tachypleus tridentatus]|uniref:programmed cell death 5 isoform X2 n=1 Tax=Tachypleus tridentatus TaxID=6853 RepID=UPI003FD4E05F